MNGMTGREAKAFIFYVCDYISRLGFQIEPSYEEPIGIGGTNSNGEDIKEQTIGIKDFEKNLDGMFPMDKVMLSVIGAFHEVGHGVQITKTFDEDSNISRVLGLNSYACHYFDYYYGEKALTGDIPLGDYPVRQYFCQPHEIAAQYAGIKLAHSFLSKEYSPEEADELILSYVKYRVSLGSEFIDKVKPNDTMKSIMRRFDKAFKTSIHAPRHYSQDPRVNQLDDLLNLNYLKSKGYDVASCSDGLMQDCMLVESEVYQWPEDERGPTLARACFKGVDFLDIVKKGSKVVVPRPTSFNTSLRDLDPDLEAIEEMSRQPSDREYEE